MKTFKEILEKIESAITSLSETIWGDPDRPEGMPDYSLIAMTNQLKQNQTGMISKRDFKSSYSWSANDYMGIDMNGVYAVTSNNNIQDFPSGVSKGGILTVKFGTNDRGIQEYVPRSTSDLYIRSYWDGSWTEWAKK